MRRFCRVVLFVVSSSLLPLSEARAGWMTGNEYLEMTELSQSFAVTGIFFGLVSGLKLAGDLTGPKILEACFAGWTAKQMGAFVTKSLDDHPERRHLSLELVTARALIAHCKEYGSSP